MYEFTIGRRNFPKLKHSNFIVNANTNVITRSRAARGARGVGAIASESTASTHKSYKMDFNNIFANINNVKPGCRKCGAAR